MGSQTAAGSSLAISVASPATADATGYAALTFTDVGQVEKLGAKQKFKGSADYGALQPSMALDNADAGQAIMQTAADDESQKLYSFRVTYQDGSKRYFQGRNFGMPETADGADSMLTGAPTIEICTKIVKVAAVA
jgi:hypothetical protein